MAYFLLFKLYWDDVMAFSGVAPPRGLVIVTGYLSWAETALPVAYAFAPAAE